MSFLNPLAWIGLATIPAIIVMYLLKQKYVEKTLPSVFLWKEAQSLSKAERPWQKLRRNLLMLLQIIMAFVLVFSLANPYVSAVALVENLVLVLDASMSMQATDVSPSRFDKAKEQMISLVGATKPESKITVIVGERAPYIAVNAASDKKKIMDSIRGIEPTYTAMDVNATKSLAESMAKPMSNGEGTVYVFTDEAVDIGENAQILFGNNVANTAVTLVKSTPDADRVVALVKVKNFGNGNTYNSVALYCDGTLHGMKDVSLGAFEEKDVFFTDVPYHVTLLEARLTNKDALPADDIGFDVVMREVTNRVTLVTEQNIFLENMLSLLPNVELIRASATDMEELAGSMLYVFDGVLPETLPTDGHILAFNPPTGNTLVETGEDVEVTGMFSRDNTLLKLIGDINFAASKSKSLTTPEWADVVLESDETPLILSGRQGVQNIVVMGFDLHNTDLPLRKEFPIFMYNLAQYFMPGGAVSGGSAKTGDTLDLNVYPDAQKVSVVTPDDQMVTLAPPFPPAALGATQLPGFYTVSQELSDDIRYDNFAVNVDTSESDLTRAQTTAGDIIQASEASVTVNKNLTPAFLAAALLLLIMEWWVFCRGH